MSVDGDDEDSIPANHDSLGPKNSRRHSTRVAGRRLRSEGFVDAEEAAPSDSTRGGSSVRPPRSASVREKSIGSSSKIRINVKGSGVKEESGSDSGGEKRGLRRGKRLRGVGDKKLSPSPSESIFTPQPPPAKKIKSAPFEESNVKASPVSITLTVTQGSGEVTSCEVLSHTLAFEGGEAEELSSDNEDLLDILKEFLPATQDECDGPAPGEDGEAASSVSALSDTVRQTRGRAAAAATLPVVEEESLPPRRRRWGASAEVVSAPGGRGYSRFRVTRPTIPPYTAPDIPPIGSDDEEEFEPPPVGERPTIVVPSCSKWFDLEAIHSIERNGLPALLTATGGSIPTNREERYMNIRNHIVEVYRQNPRKYLSLTACRSAIADCDTSILLRVHSFLDYWGLINFQVDPSSLPIPWRTARDQREPRPARSPPAEVGDREVAGSANPSVHRPPEAGDVRAGEGESQVRKCASCGKICLYSYWILKESVQGVSLRVLKKCAWCLQCVSNRSYPQSLRSGDFLKVDIPLTGVGGDEDWSEEEMTRLIEGVELYMENWKAVAAHVGGNRNSIECVMKFLRLPIDEPPIPTTPRQKESSESNHTDAGCRRSSEGREGDESNPIILQLAFLASAVRPEVVACATKSAVEEARRLRLIEDEAPREVAPGEEEDEEMRAVEERKPLSELDMQASGSAALSASAVRAEEMVGSGDKEILKILPNLLEAQADKIRLKLEQFNALQKIVEMQKASWINSINGIQLLPSKN